MFGALTVALALFGPLPAHDGYHDWRNRNNSDCCHGQDCAPVKVEDLEVDAATDAVLRIRVRGTWCPVKDWMRLSRGKSPDWSVVHACVRKSISDPCAALLCFAGRPQF